MSNVKQHGDYDCMLACISSAVRRPLEEIFPSEFREHVEAKHGTHGDDCDRALQLAGLSRDVDYWVVGGYAAAMHAIRRMLKGRRAMLQVPSLNNKPPAQHIVYWDGDNLHDPSNKQVYRWLDQVEPANVWIFNEVAR